MSDKNQTAEREGATRRDFLKAAGAATLGLAAGGLAKSPVYALQPPRVIGANDRINIGHIGVGGQGMTHVRLLHDHKTDNNTESVAVCDVWQKRRDDAKTFLGLKDNQAYSEYRRLLDSPDVDVVWIATPEHWHSRMTIDALHAGKHVYCEKPMTRYLDEALAVNRAVAQTKRVFQVGTQGCSDLKWHRAGEIVRSGKLGTLLWSQGSYCRNSKEGEWEYFIDPSANPSNLDWNAWLGPAPKRPWDPERYFRWRKYWDYSAGISSDLFPHRLNPLMVSIGAEYPTRVVASGGLYVQKDREVPDTINMLADFPTSHSVVIAGCTANEQGLDDMIRGHQATLYLGGNAVKLEPEPVFSDQIDASNEQVGHGERIEDHEANFLDCVRNGKTPNANVDLATKGQVTISMCELSYRRKKCMLFDPATLKATAA